MKKTIIIDESIREEVLNHFVNEQAHRISIGALSIAAQKAIRKAWKLVYTKHPFLQNTAANLNTITWECEFEQEEYTREGENVIEEIDPELYEVHTPPID
jgi:hypothetical protein